MRHITLATLAEVDALVSWNFKHIVRLEKIRLFNEVTVQLGYKTVNILSPREVTTLKAPTTRAVEMVRRIRDRYVRRLTGKTTDEVIAFYRAAGQSAVEDARHRAKPEAESLKPRAESRESREPEAESRKPTPAAFLSHGTGVPSFLPSVTSDVSLGGSFAGGEGCWAGS
jgi:hypothetical protein